MAGEEQDWRKTRLEREKRLEKNMDREKKKA